MERVLAEVNLGSPAVFSPAKNFTTVGSLVNVVISNAFVLAGIIAFVLLIFGAFGLIVSAGSGNSEQTEKGKNAITYAVLGLVIVVVSVWIIQILEQITGLKILNHG